MLIPPRLHDTAQHISPFLNLATAMPISPGLAENVSIFLAKSGYEAALDPGSDTSCMRGFSVRSGEFEGKWSPER